MSRPARLHRLATGCQTTGFILKSGCPPLFPLLWPHHLPVGTRLALRDAVPAFRPGVDVRYFFPHFAMERKTTSSKPVKTFRLRGITASVFRNVAKSDGRSVPYHKWTVQRTYKDKDSFKNTTSFNRDDWPIVEVLGRQVFQYILEAEAQSKDADGEE